MTREPTVQAIPAPGHDYYAVVVDDIPTAVAEVTPAAHDIDGDPVRPTTIQFIWTPPAFRGRGSVRISDIGDKDRYPVIATHPPFGGEEEPGIKANFPPDKQTAETAFLFLQLIIRVSLDR